MTLAPNPLQKKTVLIAGASGVIGSAAVEYFASQPGWDVIALSRRRPMVARGIAFAHIPVDLTDSGACSAAVASMPTVTHLVYAAATEATGLVAGWRDDGLIALNGRMFANIMVALEARGDLHHVSLLQGAKAYGAHVHPVSVPSREDEPRDGHENFYWLQEDHLREASARAGFAFTIWRPQVLLGSAPGVAMNPVAAIGAYAAICRAREQPFSMPGNGDAIWEMVDAQLMAQALLWAATEPHAAGETFNITNGDAFVLRHAWPELAQRLDLRIHGPSPTDFASFLTDPENVETWESIAREFNLVEPSLDRLLGQSHIYLDLLNGPRIASKAHPVLLSTVKLRKAGFAECRDSLDSLHGQLTKMAALHLLPEFP